ncbi:unnamed protein product [Urochloa humidicola]
MTGGAPRPSQRRGLPVATQPGLCVGPGSPVEPATRDPDGALPRRMASGGVRQACAVLRLPAQRVDGRRRRCAAHTRRWRAWLRMHGEAQHPAVEGMASCRIDEALDTLHRGGLAMVKEGKNGKALWMLKNKKEALLTAHALVGIIQKAGEALEGYIQTCPEVPHEEIVEHVSSILTNSGIVYSGKVIDTGNLECYRYSEITFDGSSSQSGDCEETNEADNSSSLEDEVIKRILIKRPPKGLALKEVRNMFFPYWKSVLSCRSLVRMTPICKPSRKDLRSAEASKKGTKKSKGNLGSMGWPQLASNYGSRRMLCAVASMSRKVLFKRT